MVPYDRTQAVPARLVHCLYLEDGDALLAPPDQRVAMDAQAVTEGLLE